jgi:hypothetical protein
MSLRDVLEYRAADTGQIVFDMVDVPIEYRALYSRPFGAQQWGWHSGEFYFDAAYKASHEGVPA